jgi:hypothetical protein
LVDGKARYVTAVSASDVTDGWRDRRRDGGVVVDVQTNEIVATGLSMPHSPRVYRGKLWLLNAGTGYFGSIDLASGKFEPLTFRPGFLRGMAFAGDYAIVGLSGPRHDKNVLFAVLPYLAVFTLILVTIQRYWAQSFTYSSLSSQFLENRQHFWGLVPFQTGEAISQPQTRQRTSHTLAKGPTRRLQTMFRAPRPSFAWSRLDGRVTR